MSKVVMGIDVGKRELSLALLMNEKFSHKVVSNDAKGFGEIVLFIKQFADTAEVYLEATGCYGEAVSDFLYAGNFDVKVVNPLQIKAFSQAKLSRHKNDKVDAKVIAEYGAKFGGRSYIPIASNIKELRELYRASLALKEELSCYNNHLENKELMAKSVVDLWEKRLNDLEENIKNIEKIMLEIINDDSDLKKKLKLLIEIPGIGQNTAMAVLAEVMRIDEFKTARQLAAYIGLTPKERTSGTSVRSRAKISKMGIKILRHALYMPAMCAKRFNPALKAFADRLAQKNKKPKQIICAVMRKLVHIIFGVLKYDLQKLKSFS